MSRVFNLSNYNNLRNALDINFPVSNADLAAMPEEERRLKERLPVVPFPELVKQKMGVEPENIDHNTIVQMFQYYMSLIDRPEQIGPAYESVKSLAIDIEPTREIDQLSAVIANVKKNKVRQDIIESIRLVFGPKSLERLKEQSFGKFGMRYDERLLAIFKQRVNANSIRDFAQLYREQQQAGNDNNEALFMAGVVRQDYVMAAANKTNEFVDLCRSYGLSDSQITWIMGHSESTDPKLMPLFQESGIDPSVITKLLNRSDNVKQTIRNYFSEFPSFLFDKNVEIMRKKGLPEEDIQTLLEIADKIGGTIMQDEYFASVNLSIIEVPQDPDGLIDKTWDTESQISRNEQIRLNIRNLRTLKALLEKGGYVSNGKTVKALPVILGESKSELSDEEAKVWEEVRNLIGEGRTLSENLESFPSGGYVDGAIWYIANNICGNLENFTNMIINSGALTEPEYSGEVEVSSSGKKPKTQIELLLGKGAILIDDRYKEFNFIHDAKDQKKAVDMLRNVFGLEVVPSKMGIPALDDCNINVEGFQIDFVVICSALQNWTQAEGAYHPVIAEQVNFVGEYMGFNYDFAKSLRLFEEDGSVAQSVIDTETGKTKNILRVEHPQGITMPDGSLAKVRLRKNVGDSEKDKVEMDAAYGVPLDGGSAYRIRSEWKKVTEDFVASITGNAAISIPPDFTVQDVMQELNKCNIIYKMQGKTAPNSPYMFVENHVKNCASQTCDSKKVANDGSAAYFRKYNIQEAMVISKILDFKMSNVIVPKLREQKEKTARAKQLFAQKIAEEMGLDVSDLLQWRAISYKEFLDKFHDEHDLGTKGFGRHEVYQYYSQKSQLQQQLFELRQSPEYSHDKEVAIRQEMQNLRNKFLQHFQEIYNSFETQESPEAVFYRENLQQLESLRQEVATDPNKYTNQQLASILNRLVHSYTPQTVAQQKKRAYNNLDLFRIAIKS